MADCGIFWRSNLQPPKWQSSLLLGVFVNIIALYYMAGGNLAHFHVWLSYGKVMNHMFISPVLHQIHHSIAPQHINKNYGEFLGIWDWMFGTLYIPEKQEKLEFGIGKDQPQPYPTVSKAYLEPVVNAVRLLIGKIPAKGGSQLPSGKNSG